MFCEIYKRAGDLLPGAAGSSKETTLLNGPSFFVRTLLQPSHLLTSKQALTLRYGHFQRLDAFGHSRFDPTGQCKGVRKITIQFHRDLFDNKLPRRNQLSFIRSLLKRSLRGVQFSRETMGVIRPRLEALVQKGGFDSVLERLSILHDLSTSHNPDHRRSVVRMRVQRPVVFQPDFSGQERMYPA